MTQGSRIEPHKVTYIAMPRADTKRNRINSNNSEGSSGSRDSPAITNLAQGEFFMDQQQQQTYPLEQHQQQQQHSASTHEHHNRESTSKSPDSSCTSKISRENSESGRSTSSTKSVKDSCHTITVTHANSTNNMTHLSPSPLWERHRIRSKISVNSREENISNTNSNANIINPIDDNDNKNIRATPSMGRRRSSMPNVSETSYLAIPTEEELRGNKLRRVRSFKTTSKGAVVNRGDSLKKKSTHSLRSAGSTATETRQLPQQQQMQQTQKEFVNDPYALEAPPIPTYFRVIMMGAAGTGKSTLAKQFMTSDNVDNTEENEGAQENTVSVLLDGEESTIQVIDPVDRNVIVEGLEQLLDAYVVVFAINDHSSLDAAQDLVRYLRVDFGTDRVVLLVGNKTDLVRKRKVSAEEARLVAETYDCKYTETSAVLNHYVDELLVGVLTQIRLHMRVPFTTISFPGKGNRHDDRERSRACKGPRKFFSKLFRRSGRKKLRECENLHSL